MNIDEVIAKIKKAVRLANKTTSEGERDTALRLARRLDSTEPRPRGCSGRGEPPHALPSF